MHEQNLLTQALEKILQQARFPVFMRVYHGLRKLTAPDHHGAHRHVVQGN